MRNYMVKLRGKVVSGTGEGRRYVLIYMSVFREKLGFEPYPGTLNIDVGFDASKIYLSLNPIVIDPPSNTYKPVYALPARIDDTEGYVIRPFATSHKWNILEFIAPYCIREKLGLRDGDLVEITLYNRVYN